MPYRKITLVQGEIYHVFTKSIAGFRIFNSPLAFQRMLEAMVLYSIEKPPCKLSLFLKNQAQPPNSKPALELLGELGNVEKIVKIIAYCIMPTHIHLILQQLKDKGISEFINLILKSYSKYFNKKYDRKGPLWEGRFKNVLVETQEQLLHLTRYIHLNPVSAYLVKDPQDWRFSSYREYVGLVERNKMICDFSNFLDLDVDSYEQFVDDHIDYARKLSQIKHLILE